jgi:phage terminase small subunit
MKLNKKQKRFCEEYIVDLNGTQAYIRAGYSKNGADVSASQLLGNPRVSEYIKEMNEKVSFRTGVTVEFVINGIKDIAVNGEMEANKLKAFDLLGKYTGIYEKDNEQSKPDAVTEIKVIFKDVKN